TSALSTLSLHDALPILGEHGRAAQPHELRAAARERTDARHPAGDESRRRRAGRRRVVDDEIDHRESDRPEAARRADARLPGISRSEEHTSELQSPYDLV